MALTKFEKDMAIIQKLDDEPNDVGGLTAAELKAKFDEGGEAVKEYLNERLLPELEDETGAAKLGAAPFDGVPGKTVQEQLRQIHGAIQEVVIGQIPDSSIGPEKLTNVMRSYYIRFEREDWKDFGADGAELRVAPEVHGLPTGHGICSRTLHMLLGRSAEDYTEKTLSEAYERFIAAQAAALAANSAAAGSYPTAEDGHVVLTWEQVQYYLLEETLDSAENAAAKAVELGFDWQGRETVKVEETVSLDALLAAGYLPALGGSSAGLDALWSLEAVQGLHLRRGIPNVTGAAKQYDLDGRMSARTWAVMEAEVSIDPLTGDLVLYSADGSWPGELLVIAAP